MAVWLRCAGQEYAFDADIIPRDAFRALTSLDALAEHCRRDVAQQQAAAQALAQQVVDSATVEAAGITEHARRAAAASARLGYAQGRRDGLRHWHADASAQRAQAAALHASQRERLAEMVVQATASLMRGPALASYLEDALQALDGLAEKDLTLSVRVAPGDLAVAQAAIERLRPKWRDGTVVRVTASADLEAGSCVCESSQGYVDASLSRQLASLRAAACGALQGLRLPEDFAADAATAAMPGHATGADAPPLPPSLADAYPLPGMSGMAGMPGMSDAPHLRYPSIGPFPGMGGGPLSDDDENRFDDLYDDEDALDDSMPGSTGSAW